MPLMKAMTGTVVDGKVELPAEFVPEGTQVMILAPHRGEPVRLSPAEEAELLEAAEHIGYEDGRQGLLLR
jgi:hypothetical protein